nr:hypothetical protein [Tanacetum cinerariifolium]
PFETDESAARPPPHPAYRTTARISIPTPVPMPTWTDSEVVRLLAISSPPASPLSPWEDRLEVTLPPRKRLDIAFGPRYEVGESSSAAARPAGGFRADYGFVAAVDREIMRDPEREVGYGITDSWDEIMETLQGAPIYRDFRVEDSLAGADHSPTGTSDSLAGTVVTPTAADQAPSVEETEPFETDESAATPPPHPAYRTTARISIPAPVPMPAWTDSEVVRLLAISSPPASPLSPWSSPPPQIPFLPPPPMLSPPSPILAPTPPPSPIPPPPSPIRSLGYRAAMIRLRDEATCTSHLPPSQLPSASRREDRPEVTLPPRKRLDIALGPRYEVGESSSAAATRPAGGFRADYGFVAAVDREIMRDPEREVGYGITDAWDEIVETL